MGNRRWLAAGKDGILGPERIAIMSTSSPIVSAA
jgi:hypothetical protein